MPSRNTYGRHGPDAWRKWYERRYQQASPPRVALVILHVPTHLERVVVILMPEPLNDPQNTGGFSVPRLLEAGQGPNGQTPGPLDAKRQVGSIAFAEGNKKGTNDRGRKDLCSVDELEDAAMHLSAQYSADPQHRALLAYHTSEEIIEAFEAQYQAGYLRGAKLKDKEELPSEALRAIQRRAHHNKEMDERKGDALTEDLLLAQAIECALESIGIRSTERKEGVTTFISSYVKAYQEYIPPERYEQDGNSFRPFS